MQIKDALLGNRTIEGKERAEAARNGRPAGKVSAEGPVEGDRVELSGRSREMARAHETLAATPPVRQEKIDAIKERIQNHEYEVDAEKVAHKMITDFLDEIT